MKKNKEIYDKITDKIISKIKENNCLPWSAGFNQIDYCNYTNYNKKTKEIKSYYHGGNIVMIWLFSSNANDIFHLTFNQIRKLKGHLKKGSSGIPIMYYDIKKKKVDYGKYIEKYKNNPDKMNIIEENGIPEFENIPCLKQFLVFNQSQIEGINFPDLAVNEDIENIDIEDFINNQNIDIRHNNNNRAYYAPTQDYINLPDFKYFHNSNSYYKVLFHELIHSTGHPDKLNRPMTGHGSGEKEKYSFEELTAEIGSAFLMSMFNLSADVDIDNSASYINSWIKTLENNTDWIIKASNKAQKAIDYLLETYKENKIKNNIENVA